MKSPPWKLPRRRSIRGSTTEYAEQWRTNQIFYLSVFVGMVGIRWYRRYLPVSPVGGGPPLDTPLVGVLGQNRQSTRVKTSLGVGGSIF